MSEETMKRTELRACPHAYQNVLYGDCPKDIHGVEGERCNHCPSLGTNAAAPNAVALSEALAALRWIASNADVPSDFPNAPVRLRQIRARAAEALADIAAIDARSEAVRPTSG